MSGINITITDSPDFGLCAKQVLMTKGDEYAVCQIDNFEFRKLLQTKIKEGFKMFNESDLT